MQVLVVLVAYNNHADVESYIDHLGRLETGTSLRVAICDNSPPGAAKPFHEDIPQVTRADNPGYLEGGLLAYEAACGTEYDEPDWVILSNTDLSFRKHELGRVLSHYSADEPLVLAPRITETDVLLDMNPHLRQRRSLARLSANYALSSTPLLCRGYLAANALRERRRAGRAGVGAGTPPADVLQGARMYAPHGAMVIFSRGFMQRAALPREVPLLAEEFAIAETARQIGAPVLFEPRLHAHHEAHATTGPLGTRRRAALLTVAFRYILEHRLGRAAPRWVSS